MSTPDRRRRHRSGRPGRRRPSRPRPRAPGMSDRPGWMSVADPAAEHRARARRRRWCRRGSGRTRPRSWRRPGRLAATVFCTASTRFCMVEADADAEHRHEHADAGPGGRVVDRRRAAPKPTTTRTMPPPGRRFHRAGPGDHAARDGRCTRTGRRPSGSTSGPPAVGEMPRAIWKYWPGTRWSRTSRRRSDVATVASVVVRSRNSRSGTIGSATRESRRRGGEDQDAGADERAVCRRPSRSAAGQGDPDQQRETPRRSGAPR